MIEKEYWKNFQFTENKFPQIICPSCKKGHLKIVKNSLNTGEISDSRENREHPDWEPDWIEYRFSVSLKCDNANCRDNVVCIGNGSNNQYTEYDYFEKITHSAYQQYYKPLYFLPPLNIIELDDNYPKDLKRELINSFSHFFSDFTACANKIRVCVEILMNDLKVKKTENFKGKRQRLTLHNRIISFKSINSDVADYLLAIKWIGNSGSHNFGSLNNEDILDAYNLLDFSLKKIYNNPESALKKLTKKINKKRAPLSKRK